MLSIGSHRELFLKVRIKIKNLDNAVIGTNLNIRKKTYFIE